jgi:hypothetical protein
MDTERIVLLFVGFSLVGGFLINVVLGAIVRLRALQRQPSTSSIEARLDRIEAVIDAIAFEAGRSGGMERVADRLERPAFSITPH